MHVGKGLVAPDLSPQRTHPPYSKKRPRDCHRFRNDRGRRSPDGRRHWNRPLFASSPLLSSTHGGLCSYERTLTRSSPHSEARRTQRDSQGREPSEPGGTRIERANVAGQAQGTSRAQRTVPPCCAASISGDAGQAGARQMSDRLGRLQSSAYRWNPHACAGSTAQYGWHRRAYSNPSCKSASGMTLSVSVTLLFPSSGSVTLIGGATLALLLMLPAACGDTRQWAV